MEKLKRTATMILAAAILLLPSMGIAGNLEPSGPPAPTMKTLDQIPPTWNRAVFGAERFDGSMSLLDKETGLLWMHQFWVPQPWAEAQLFCYRIATNVGNDFDPRTGNFALRYGWRVPTFDELATLFDPGATTPPPYLPDGHRFVEVQSGPDDCYWSSTESPLNPDDGLAIRFGVQYPIVAVLPKTSLCAVACVRGGR